MTLHELSEKDVIQIKTGENLGRIDDVIFDGGAAKLQSVVLGYDEDLIIPWEALKTIGTDVIMVDAEPLPVQRRSR